MYKEVFAERLKRARELTELTQNETAKMIGISQSTLAKYETGDREPDVETIGKLAEFYAVSVDWLLGLGMQGNKPNYEKSEYKTREKSIKELG